MKSHLGIYDSIKLSSFLKNKQGKVIELISVDRNSSNSFVSEEAEDLLRQYATNEIAFVLVAGNQEAGKSFFCDKILNLCEIRGNNVHMWGCSFAGKRMQGSISGPPPSKRTISRYSYSKSADAPSNPSLLGFYSLTVL